MFARFALAGGAVAPPIPTITYGSITNGGTQITATITNFSSEFGYVATSNVGTLSRTNGNITVTGLPVNTSVNILVIATSARGLSTPSSAVTDRQPYTFRTETRTGTRFVDTTSCYTASPTEPRCPFGGTLNVAGTECCIPSGYTETYTFTVEIRNDAPAGYLDSGFDWYRPSNVSIERIPYTFYQYQETYTYSCQVSSTCCVDLEYDEQYTYTVTVDCWRCGDPCVNGQCPPNSPWGCGIAVPCGGGNCAAWGAFCTETRTGTRRVCCRPYCSPCTINSTCTGTRTVTARNPTPPGYTDSGVDWYRFL